MQVSSRYFVRSDLSDPLIYKQVDLILGTVLYFSDYTNYNDVNSELQPVMEMVGWYICSGNIAIP